VADKPLFEPRAVAPPRRRRPANTEPTGRGWTDASLAELGLAEGDTVRFRRSTDGSWKQATVERREKDGSLGLRDVKGAARAVPIDQVQVRRHGPKGGLRWIGLADQATADEQLRLL